MLTSNCDLVANHAEALLPGIHAAFHDDIYASGRPGIGKPDPAVFRALVTHPGIASAEALFVYDLPENVAGAREAGLHAHHFTGIDKSRDMLRRFGAL